MSFIALIPARKGSKRLRNKNIKILKGKPLIFYSINAALKSKFIKETHVFSDNGKINKLAKEMGANTDTKRPKSISTGDISMLDTINFFLNKNKTLKKKYTYLVLLQPTSPQRTSKDLDKACKKILDNKKAEALISSYKLDNLHPNRIMFLNNGYLTLNKSKSWSQSSAICYRNGPSILIVKISKISKKNFYENCRIINFNMSKKKSIDIDTISDFEKAKNFFE